MPGPDIALANLSRADWLAALEALGEEEGYFQSLGSAHHALFLDRGRRLFVTFETLEAAQTRPRGRPRGLDFAAAEDWSVLALFSDGDTWFRATAVWRTFDRLTDDGFFEDFDRVLFFGAGSAAHAACALSVAAPGARVLAIRPQATLATDQAGWDRRFVAERRRDFTSRYGYAPDMVEGALSAHILFDPHVAADAMHAALFTRPNVLLHRMPLAGPRPEIMLDQIGATPLLIRAAMEGQLDRAAFARIWRRRRGHAAWLRALLRRFEAQERMGAVAAIARAGLATREAGYFARRLTDFGLGVQGALRPPPATEAAQ